MSKPRKGFYYENHADLYGLVGACLIGHIGGSHEYHSKKKGYKGFYQISYGRLAEKLGVTPKTIQRTFEDLIGRKNSPLIRKNMGTGQRVSYGYKPSKWFYSVLSDVDKMSITKSPCGQNVHNDIDKMSISHVDKMSKHINKDNNNNIHKGGECDFFSIVPQSIHSVLKDNGKIFTSWENVSKTENADFTNLVTTTGLNEGEIIKIVEPWLEGLVNGDRYAPVALSIKEIGNKFSNINNYVVRNNQKSAKPQFEGSVIP